MSDSGSWITALRRLALYIRGMFICVYCLRDLRNAKPSDITLDHVRATGAGHRGADHRSSNLVVCCVRCNSAKKDRTLSEFATPEAQRRVRNQTRRKVNMTMARSLLATRQSHEQTARRDPAADTRALTYRHITTTVNDAALLAATVRMYGAGHPMVTGPRHWRDCYVACRNAANARRHDNAVVDLSDAYWYAAS